MSDPLIISNIQPVELVGRSVLLVLKHAPIELNLLSRLGFIAHHRIVASSCGTQRMDKLFEHTQAALVAHFQQAGQHGLTIVTVVLLDPLLDLLLERI